MTNTLPISKVREDLTKLVENAKKKLHRTVITVNGLPEAILMSVAEFESWQETMDILSDPKLVADIKASEKEFKEGKGLDWEDVKKDLDLDLD